MPMRSATAPLAALILLFLPGQAVPELKIGSLYTQPFEAVLNASWSDRQWGVRTTSSLVPGYHLAFPAVVTAASAMDLLEGARQLVADGAVAIIVTSGTSILTPTAVSCSVAAVPILSLYSTASELEDKTQYPFLFRAMPSEAPQQKAIAVLIYELGWRRCVALMNANLWTGAGRGGLPALEALGVIHSSMSYTSPTDAESREKLRAMLARIPDSGYRIIALFSLSADMPALHAASAAAGLQSTRYCWVITEQGYVGEWRSSSDVLVAVQMGDFTSSPGVAASGSNGSTGAYGRFGMVAYDTVHVLAKALQAAVESGDSPSNGTLLRDALLDVTHSGVSGDYAFSRLTQDRELPVRLLLTRGGALPPHVVARTTEQLAATEVGADGWCRSGCMNATAADLAALPWSRGQQPEDGRGLDTSKSDAYFVYTRVWESRSVQAGVTAVDSFGQAVCVSSCATNMDQATCDSCKKLFSPEQISFDFLDSTGRRLWGKCGRKPFYHALGPGLYFIGYSCGFWGASAEDREVYGTMSHKGRELKAAKFLLMSTHCHIGHRGKDGKIPCDKCPPGSIAPAKGMVNCTQCPPGFRQPNAGAGACLNCTLGTFTSAGGSTKCEACALGRFQSELGKSECSLCPEPMTTLGVGESDVAACVCPSGFYRPRGTELRADMPAGPCSACPKGMRCPVAADARNFPKPGSAQSLGPYPQLLPSYWAHAEDPQSVFFCPGGDKQCLGGPAQSCGPHLSGRSCAVCDEGFYLRKGVCKQCPNKELTSFLFPALPILVSVVYLVLAYWLEIDHEGVMVWNNSSASLGHIFGLALLYVQTAGLVTSCNLNLPEAASSDFVKMAMSPLVWLQLECAGVRSFEANLALNMLLPAYLCSLFAAAFLLSAVLGRIVPRLRMELDVMVNCLGGTVVSFYTTNCALSFDLFKCFPHPSGEYSLVSQPQILCHSETWFQMVAFAVVSLVVSCGGSLAVFIWVLKVAWAHRNDEHFQKRWKFLLDQFRLDTDWWWLLVLCKGIALNVVQVVLILGQNQLLALQLLLATYATGTAAWHPWRHKLCNYLDSATHLGLAIFCSFLYWHARVEDLDDPFRLFVVQYGLWVPCVLIPLSATPGLKRWFIETCLPHRHKHRQSLKRFPLARCRMRFSHFSELEDAEIHAMLEMLPPVDRSLMEQAVIIVERGLQMIGDKGRSATVAFATDSMLMDASMTGVPSTVSRAAAGRSAAGAASQAKIAPGVDAVATAPESAKEAAAAAEGWCAVDDAPDAAEAATSKELAEEPACEDRCAFKITLVSATI